MSIFVIGLPSPPEKCEECGKIAELRPYGKNHKLICFDCGMKDEKETAKNFKFFLEGKQNEN